MDTIPDLTLVDPNGAPVKLTALPRPLVVYFYPKDDTTGCTREAQDFSALAGDFAKAGVTVLGVSKDSPKRHANFIAKYAAKTAPEYPVASAVVVGQGPGDAGGTNVDARITLRSGATYDIRWLVMKSGSGYKVRDAQVVGFWMTSFLDDLFQNYITENGNNPRALVLALSR